MNSRHFARMNQRIPRSSSEAFRGASYGACIEKPLPTSFGPAFWVKVAASIVMWTVFVCWVNLP